MTATINTNDATSPSSPAVKAAGEEVDHDWQDAGRAWSLGAADWATLFEHYGMDMFLALFPRLGLGPGVELLDIACGSGLGVRLAGGMGAQVSAIDAAESLIGVARDRFPDADIRHGSMFDLPWADESFDAAVSINGIWGGCEAALEEAFRVLRPGSPIGISFWGPGRPLHLRDAFKVIAANSPADAVGGMVKTNGIAIEGVAEEMLTAAGFTVIERGTRVSTLEWPDADIAWRALRSVGPMIPALQTSDEAELRTAVLAAIDHCRDSRGVYRFENDHHFVTARKQ